MKTMGVAAKQELTEEPHVTRIVAASYTSGEPTIKEKQ
jgi:hypothetical protein